MGSLCSYHRSEDLRNYSISQKSETGLTSCQISMTLATATHTQGDCILLFVDDHCKVKENFFLKRADERIASKAQEYLDVYLARNRMIVGDCALIEIDIENLPVRYLAVLCIEVWPGGTGELIPPLEDDLEEALTKLSSSDIKKLIIT